MASEIGERTDTAKVADDDKEEIDFEIVTHRPRSRTSIELAYQYYPRGWEVVFNSCKKEFDRIFPKLAARRAEGKRIVPDDGNIFRIFDMLAPRDIKVVIVGMDPYPTILPDGRARAQGMAFSVAKSDQVPASLINIYKEIERTHSDFRRPTHGDLTGWVRQGVLLLNVCLTCNAEESNSHARLGLWLPFIKPVINYIRRASPNAVYVLWGGQAQEGAGEYIKSRRVLTSSHPSPLSATKGKNPFMGNNHFVQINQFLVADGNDPIDWGYLP
jgi:uracil-DNA glycosylase